MRQYTLLACALIGPIAVGCGDGGSPTPPPPDIPPAALEIVSGNNQTGTADRPLALPLRVRVLGSENQPVAGAAVQWSVTQGNAALDPEQSITDANGEGQTEVSLGTSIGTAAVSATVGGLPSVIFSITVVGSSDFIAVSAGADHTCGLAPTGEVYCWGSNEFGQLGDGTTTDRLHPTLVLGGLSFSSVSAGAAHTCGLTTDGTAYCWGENSSGQLGDGTTNDQLVPVSVAGDRRYSVISTADSHACAVTTAGAAYCWGQNSFGQLGIGTTNGPEECSVGTQATPCSTAPVAVAGGLNFTGIGVGSAHTCALTGVGTAYCWGENSRGVVGDGTTIQRTSPVPVARGLTFTSIAVSFINSCGLNAEGAAFCWGWNREGQLGVASAQGPETCVFPPPLGGSTDCSSVPAKVVGVIFTALGSGVQNGHLCGVTGAALYCWGLNLDGRLGTGLATGPESCPQPNAAPVPCSTLAVPVEGGLTFVQVSMGGDHACGVTAQGLAYCWGVNNKGELGDGTTTRRLTPVPVSFE